MTQQIEQPGKLAESLHEMLERLRGWRGFRKDRYIQAKTRLFNDYLRHSGLSAVVIGLSGGVDSALTLALALHAAREPDSPIKRVHAALLPYFIEAGTSRQDDATKLGQEVLKGFNHPKLTSSLIDLSESHGVLKKAVDKALDIPGDAWAAGQLVSYLRTPALFYITSLLTQSGYPSILVGTTNRDEGGYIGYFGKAADAMVDLQLISDLHKSEVYELARAFEIPAQVLQEAPTGDIYDGRTDEELIGVPYDFIELYSLYLAQPDRRAVSYLLENLDREGQEQFEFLSKRLNKLNSQNAHKYASGSQSIHLDVMERAVPGGWRQDIDQEALKAGMTGGNFVNLFQLPEQFLSPLQKRVWQVPTTRAEPLQRENIADYEDSAFILKQVMNQAECAAFLHELDQLEWVPVGLNGMRKDYKEGDKIGSYRASLFSEPLAHCLFERIASAFPLLRIMDPFTPADFDGAPVWRACGINPLMRFIKYEVGGSLVPHYDAPFDYYDGKRTIMSMVLYLTQSKPEDGGATRFILEPQVNIPPEERNYEDWKREAGPEEIVAIASPGAGDALFLDHRVLHDGQLLNAGRKIIMRTDVIFERCGLPPRRKPGVSKPLGMPERQGYD